MSKEEEPLKANKEKSKGKTLKEKLVYVKENITVEPVLITSVIPGALARLATQNLNLDKACRVNLKYGDTVCDALIAKNGNEYQNEELAVQELIASMETEISSCVGSVRSFFDVRHVKNTLSVAFKNGPNHRRMKFILILASIAFIYGPAYGEYTVRYLFTRYRFNWDAVKYSFYNTFYSCLHIFGSLISITIFSRRWQWQDASLGILSTCSKLIGGLATGLSRNSLEMYLAVAFETFNATSFTALRSISSKLVSSDELGKMTSVFNLMEILTSMMFGPIYSWIYMVTLKIDASIIYYCSTVLIVPAILIYCWLYCQEKKENLKANELKIGLNKNDHQLSSVQTETYIRVSSGEVPPFVPISKNSCSFIQTE